MAEIDWDAIRADYEKGLSLRQLAGKYGASKSVIGKRKYAEKWKEPLRTTKKDVRTPIQTQGVEHPDRNAAVRAALGFRLRFQEHQTWDEVAKGAGYASRGAAHSAVMREAQRHITRDIDETRDLERYRLEQLQKRCYEEATDKANAYWGFAVDRYVTLSKRKSELLNLDKRPEEDLMNQPYEKRIILVDEVGGVNASSN